MLNIVHSAGYYLYLIFEECKNLGGQDGKMILEFKGVKDVWRDALWFLETSLGPFGISQF